MTHEALYYQSDLAYASAVGRFVRSGIEAGEPVMVMAPVPRLKLLREEVGPLDGTRMENMAEVGRNPARIIPAVLEFLQHRPGQPARIVLDTTWASRSRQEVVEAARHEALLNVAFGASDVQLLCPYEAASFPPGMANTPTCTHPQLVMPDGTHQRSEQYEAPLRFTEAGRWPLTDPVAVVGPESRAFTEPGPVRKFVEEAGRAAGLSEDRLDDLVLTVNELASNSLIHGGGQGTVTVWNEPGTIVFEVADRGVISDPLAGRRPPGPDLDARGLWLVNQLSDLAEIRSGPGGTRARVTFETP